MSETSERKKTSEAAKELGISENTLRKYSKIVEEVTREKSTAMIPIIPVFWS